MSTFLGIPFQEELLTEKDNLQPTGCNGQTLGNVGRVMICTQVTILLVHFAMPICVCHVASNCMYMRAHVKDFVSMIVSTFSVKCKCCN